MTLHHYTVESGHLRESPRSEVGDDVIALLVPLLVAGEHAMPHPTGYRLRVTVDGTALAATVHSPAGAPLVTTVVVVDEAGLAAALRVTGARPPMPLRPPAAIVTLHPTARLDAGSLGWLGDFERCLAWAWIEATNAKTPPTL